VAKPFSIDNPVWAPVFDLHEELRPSYAGPFDDLWDGLDRLVAAASEPPLATGPRCLAAFSAWVPAPRAGFGPALSAHHLFVDPAPADEFREYANRALAPHAPFVVYCVWRVQDLK
jgi:hypothetical protein